MRLQQVGHDEPAADRNRGPSDTGLSGRPGPGRSFQQAFHDGVLAGPDGVHDFIALSGGGSNRAFAAGLMKGWPETGARPDLEVVTGVSTGALASPFVFLGSDYDDLLEEAYTGGAASNLLQSQEIGALFGSAICKGEPWRAVVERYVTAGLLRAVAAAKLPSKGVSDTG